MTNFIIYFFMHCIESSPARGKKRKHEDGGESGN